ncbi:SDR family NAD(P)-dependent oxidoreductase [Bradyrhizobium sp. th.b2]|uniref:SDR family NAD(P)-dependent oxidoreductase n=1 Tax=Bradyrhizobium sp. th-b2 TaxID=172088 RepID=UPI00041901A2|nr:SDR family NAD(P)-dependent oxidoreductase [Bradyrhizobium sp. th.b2]
MIFSNRFAGKTLVVTGAAQGIGRAVALRAAAEGGNVLFVDRADFVDDVAAEAGARGRSFVCDLETYDGAASAMAEALGRFGGIDILINNVGGAIRMRPYNRFEPQQIDTEIRRSLMPTLWCCHAVLPHFFLKSGGGTIVNISSNATRGIHRVPYSAAKGGINAATQSLAMEYASQSLSTGSCNFPTRVYENAPDLVEWLASEMLAYDVKPEIEAFDLSMIFQAVAMQKQSKIKGPLHVQFVMGVKNAMPVDRETFEFYIKTLKRLAPDATWTGAGIGKDQITVNAWSLELGGHCRTGLEDNVRLDRGRLAPSNAALVERVVELCDRYGRHPATVREARTLLKLTV